MNIIFYITLFTYFSLNENKFKQKNKDVWQSKLEIGIKNSRSENKNKNKIKIGRWFITKHLRIECYLIFITNVLLELYFFFLRKFITCVSSDKCILKHEFNIYKDL